MKKTIQIIIEKVLNFKELEKEIIIVDDCSTDGTSEIIELLSKKYPEIKYIKSLEKSWKRSCNQKRVGDYIKGYCFNSGCRFRV